MIAIVVEVGKGTHFGIKRVDHFIRSCSDNYSKDTWILKLDIKWFFMHINKDILSSIVSNFIINNSSKISVDTERLLRLSKVLIYHDPTQDYYFLWNKDGYIWLPSDKSLFNCPTWVWLPIGNLTSQLFANIYMDIFDKWIKHTIWCKYYGRYVDDFVIIHHDKKYLLDLIPKVSNFLYLNLWLILHPNKIYLQHYTKGVTFCGAMILPYRTYIHRRTIKKWKHTINTSTYKSPQTIQSMMNSYLWLIWHHRHYHLKNKILSKFISIYPDFTIKNGFISTSTDI